MTAILYVEINIIGLFVLILMYAKGRYSFRHQLTQRSFNDMLGITAVLLVLDSLMWIIDGKQFSGAREINVAVSVLFFSFTAILGLAWIAYCYCKIFNRIITAKAALLSAIPVLVNLLVSVGSVEHKWAFYVDSTNTYHRGSLYFVHATVLGAYFIVSAVMMLLGIHRLKATRRREVIMLFWFLVPPIIGFILQSLFYGLSLVLICCVCSLLIIFLNVQSGLITTDILTKLNNRTAFNFYLKVSLTNIPEKKRLFLIMIDADDFKLINDTCGHAAGDNALIKIAGVLKSSCVVRKDFIARTGGDEFVIIGLRENENDVRALIETIHHKISDIDSDAHDGYHLALSIGYAMYDEEMMGGADDLIRAADNAMYEMKRKKKSAVNS